MPSLQLKPKEGDRIQEDHGEQTIITPRSKSNAHNFGPASSRDDIVNTCQRPGGDTSLSGGNAKIETVESVNQWMGYMTAPERNIQHVFILLSHKELEDYDEPGLIFAYESAGMTVHHLPIASEGSFQRIMRELDQLFDKREKAVAHCTHGMGRSGRVAAGWLVHKYNLTVEEATEEVLESARKYGVERMGALGQLREWVGNSN